MTTDNGNFDEKVMEALLAKRRAVAILIAHRCLGSNDLPRAWHLVNELGDDKRFEQPNQDPNTFWVKNYLEGTESWKEKSKFLGFAAVFLVVGALLVYFKLPAFRTGIESYWWQTCEASILNVKNREFQVLRNDRAETWTVRDYQYAFEFGSQTYRKIVRDERFFPTLGEAWIASGDSITIYFDPDDPDRSFPHREMYARSFMVVVGLAIMTPGVFFVCFFAYRERSYRYLARHDPQPNPIG